MTDYFNANSKMLDAMPFCSDRDELAEGMAFKQVLQELIAYCDGRCSDREMHEALNNLEDLTSCDSTIVKLTENFRTLVHFDPDERREYGLRMVKDIRQRIKRFSGVMNV
jgi:tellurite resistance protein